MQTPVADGACHIRIFLEVGPCNRQSKLTPTALTCGENQNGLTRIKIRDRVRLEWSIARNCRLIEP